MAEEALEACWDTPEARRRTIIHVTSHPLERTVAGDSGETGIGIKLRVLGVSRATDLGFNVAGGGARLLSSAPVAVCPIPAALRRGSIDR
jgi:hypothetical protein